MRPLVFAIVGGTFAIVLMTWAGVYAVLMPDRRHVLGFAVICACVSGIARLFELKALGR